MANKDNKRKQRVNNINSSLDNIDTKMNDIFQSTYNSRSDNKKALTKITDDIYDSVNTILSGNETIQNVPNISRLYSRIADRNSGGSKEVQKGINELFSNEALLNSISMTPETNKYLKALDAQYDMICKYMPKLDEALDIKKDNVLSADNFNKEFINVISDKLSDDEKSIFEERTKELKKKYKIDSLFDKIYSDTSKYGEYFLYCVPYNKAFEELLKNKGLSTLNSVRYESASILESGSFTDEADKTLSEEILKECDISDANVQLEFDDSNILSGAVMEYSNAKKIKKKLNKKRSMYEAFTEAVLNKEPVSNKSVKTDKRIFDDSIDYGKEFDDIANDGLMPTNNGKDNDTDISINEIPGCVCKKLKHENVIPIYIEDICIGYYYLEFSYNDNYDPARNNIINSAAFPTRQSEDLENQTTDNPMLSELSSRISSAIDSKFINNNQDIKEEIYIMLKYNDQFNIRNGSNNIKVTFLPVDDVYHFYFELDEETHHGVSDLKKSLIPAMFWCLLDLSTTVGIVSRSQDKRIYYVKQNVETNVARTLMNVINQVKKGNMGIRQMESMNNILNIVGRYNDHVIPMGPSGDAPIQFEIMNGQQIDTPETLLNKWEEAAVNATDVPLEIVNSSMQADFAIKYTMSNSKFLRKVYKRQFICEEKYSEIYTRIYNYEYQENESDIEIRLPAPAFLSITNGSQLLQNAKEFIQGLADTEYPEGPEKEKNEFIKLMLRYYLPTHINIPLIDRTKSMAKINVVAQSVASGEEDQ